MKYTRYFDWSHSDDYGHGWIMRGMPNFDPADPIGMAHDVLEHITPNDDSMEAEMRAFGVIIWGRGTSGWFHRTLGRHRVGYNLSADLVRFIMDTFNHGEDLEEAPPGRGRKRLDDDELESLLFETFKYTLRSLRDEAPSYFDHASTVDLARDFGATFMRRALPWMRMGMQQAARRYRDTSPDDFTWMFEELAQALAKQPEGDTGDVLRVTVDTEAMRTNVERGYLNERGNFALRPY